MVKKCISTPGIWAFKGCPDTDSDGIMDNEDECPEIAGLVEFKGCPDSDGDKIMDKLVDYLVDEKYTPALFFKFSRKK